MKWRAKKHPDSNDCCIGVDVEYKNGRYWNWNGRYFFYIYKDNVRSCQRRARKFIKIINILDGETAEVKKQSRAIENWVNIGMSEQTIINNLALLKLGA